MSKKNSRQFYQCAVGFCPHHLSEAEPVEVYHHDSFHLGNWRLSRLPCRSQEEQTSAHWIHPACNAGRRSAMPCGVRECNFNFQAKNIFYLVPENRKLPLFTSESKEVKNYCINHPIRQGILLVQDDPDQNVFRHVSKKIKARLEWLCTRLS